MGSLLPASHARCGVALSGIREPPPLQREGPAPSGLRTPYWRGCLALLQREGSRRASGCPGATRPGRRSSQICPHCWCLLSSGRCGGQRRCPRPSQGARAARRGVPTGGCLCAEAWANGLKIAWAERRAIFSPSRGPSQFPGQQPLGQDRSGGLGVGRSTLLGPHPSWASPPPDPRISAQPALGRTGEGERA